MAIAAASPNVYWFITRGSGLVTLILLTLTVALGVANVQRLQSGRVPRFVITAVHRNASLLALVFLAIHIVTVVLDGYVHDPARSTPSFRSAPATGRSGWGSARSRST